MHDLLAGLELTKESEQKAGYFLKIEELQLVTFLSLCNEIQPTHIFDIGANIGFYTLATCKYFQQPQYHCFEPTPETFRHLDSNLRANSVTDQVTAHQMAASSQRGEIEFHDFNNLSGKNGVAKTSIHNDEGSNTILVPTDLLDTMFTLSQERLLLKIDTEGHEAEVLLGARRLLTENECALQIEVGHGEDSLSVTTQLESMNYKLMFTLGPDAYYSNIKGFTDSVTNLNLLSTAASRFIDIRWSNRFSF